MDWPACDDGYLATLLGWVRHDVIEGLRSCTGLPCDVQLACVRAWSDSLIVE
ncbi:MAG: hypothetical protein H6722_29695 [Sandaracinus sp.]|nr:hypothetical protein [Sandaracinus sp.]